MRMGSALNPINSSLIATAIGLPIGGVLVDAWGWRTTFFVNIPVALLALGMAAFWIPRDPPAGAARTAQEVAARLESFTPSRSRDDAPWSFAGAPSRDVAFSVRRC
jgi:predicted MFS family arabinose efflux permease